MIEVVKKAGVQSVVGDDDRDAALGDVLKQTWQRAVDSSYSSPSTSSLYRPSQSTVS